MQAVEDYFQKKYHAGLVAWMCNGSPEAVKSEELKLIALVLKNNDFTLLNAALKGEEAAREVFGEDPDDEVDPDDTAKQDAPAAVVAATPDNTDAEAIAMMVAAMRKLNLATTITRDDMVAIAEAATKKALAEFVTAMIDTLNRFK